MSDGATGGVPAAAPATAPAAPAQGEAKQPKGTKPAEASQEWGEKDDAELFERLQKAPWAKVKANGEEKRITSREEFLALATDASRSRGMNKLAEQTKREMAEARAAKEEHAAHKEMLARARRGDVKALRELGLVPDDERAALQREWEAMSPQQQEVYRRNHELESKLAAVEAKEREETEKAAATKKAADREKVLGEAREHAKAVLKDVKAELYDVELPEIIGAMRSLKEAGNKLGRDYTPEQLAAYVQQRREAGLNSRVATLKPEAAVRLAMPHLKALIATPEGIAQLEEVLGVDFEAIAGALSGRRLQKWKAAKQKAALAPTTNESRREEREKEEHEPLSPFRFRAR